MSTTDQSDSRKLFHAACAGKNFSRPPFWVMRQAGRYLPEYRALKEKHSFLEIVKTPELAVEASLQPIRRFGFDCSIIFSDILVVCEAIGIKYDFKDGGGIILEKKISSCADIDALDASPENIRKKLFYVADALKILRGHLPQKAVLGFCGAPFTLAAYMVEGQSSTDFSKYKKFFADEKNLFRALMDKLTAAVCEYVKMQIESGVDGIQIFDSHASLTPQGEYENFSGEWNKKILDTMRGKTNSILFANGMNSRFDEVVKEQADVYSVNSGTALSALTNKQKGEYALQGNLAADTLSFDTPQNVAKKTREILADMFGSGRHIFNLGHGIRPDAKLENVEAMCQTIKEFAEK